MFVNQASLLLAFERVIFVTYTKYKIENYISIDFIIELSKLMEFNIIITVVDLVSKRTYFTSTHIIVIIENTIRLF